MKHYTYIEKVFVTASSLAQYVENGLADDPTRSAQCKALAQELEKLIVNAEDSKEFAFIKDGFENMKVGLKQVAEQMTARDTSKADVPRALPTNHPVALGVGAQIRPNHEFTDMDVKTGTTTEGRSYVKTTFRSADRNLKNVRFTIWEDLTRHDRIEHNSKQYCGFRIKAIHDLTRFQITKITPIGESKFNQNFDDVTVKLVNI